MITLGIDPSLTGFGWCVHNSTQFGPGRVEAKGVFTTDAKQLFVDRYRYLRQCVEELLTQYPHVENVGVESPIYGEEFSEGAYALFVYVNEAIYLCRKDVVHFDPTTVKMLAKMDSSIRRGKMDKQDMIGAAVVDSGIKKSWNHNEADAYIIARSAARFFEFLSGYLQQEELTPSEHQAFLGKARKGASYKEGTRFFRFSNLPPNEKL